MPRVKAKDSRTDPREMKKYLGWITCPECGKTFNKYTDMWVYRKQHQSRMYFFCGWNCLRRFEKKLENSKNETHRKCGDCVFLNKSEKRCDSPDKIWHTDNHYKVPGSYACTVFVEKHK